MDIVVNRNIKNWLFLPTISIIFALIPFHAFLSVWVGYLFGFSLVWKSWKEILLIILGLLGIWILAVSHDLRHKIVSSRINQLVLILVLVHLIGAVIFNNSLQPLWAGLAIDLRMYALFLAAQLAVILQSDFGRRVIKIIAVGGLIVVGFGVLQIFILPHDFLTFFGYGPNTIMPYLTVDANDMFVRISSTLRGPNPLGVYVMILLSLLIAWWVSNWQKLELKKHILLGVFSLGALIVEFATYSRSAWMGLLVACLIIVAVKAPFQRYWRWWLSGGLAMILIFGAYLSVQDSYLIQNIVVHKDPDDPAGNDSNQAHAQSLVDGLNSMFSQPLGAGPGSTGSASLMGDKPYIIESQYLFVAHEAGWAGLLLFLVICAMLGLKLYKHSKDWLALGLLASLIGILAIGILQPVWVDDTVSLIWWGLAGVFIGKIYKPNVVT